MYECLHPSWETYNGVLFERQLTFSYKEKITISLLSLLSVLLILNTSFNIYWKISTVWCHWYIVTLAVCLSFFLFESTYWTVHIIYIEPDLDWRMRPLYWVKIINVWLTQEKAISDGRPLKWPQLLLRINPFNFVVLHKIVKAFPSLEYKNMKSTSAKARFMYKVYPVDPWAGLAIKLTQSWN